jgi:hypothetical protein
MRAVNLPTRAAVSGRHSVTPAGRAVDAAASALGVKAEDPRGSGHYGAEDAFCPVVYRVVMISQAATARHDAENSYRDSIRLDEPEWPALVSVACEHCDPSWLTFAGSRDAHRADL